VRSRPVWWFGTGVASTVVLTPAGHEVLERAIVAPSIDHRLMTPLNDNEAPF
jgi:hypothetical protein